MKLRDFGNELRIFDEAKEEFEDGGKKFENY